MSDLTVLTNGRIFTACQPNDTQTEFKNCMVINGKIVSHVGKDSDQAAIDAIKDGARVVDLEDHVVTPSFIDAHTHLLLFGLSLKKLDLSDCTTFDSLIDTIDQYAKANPDLTRILCRSWNQDVSKGRTLATVLDKIDSRPIYVEASDLHSSWLNTSALKDLPMEEMIKVCGVHVAKDSHGNPTGLLSEQAHIGYVWPFLINSVSDDEQMSLIKEVVELYTSAGYGGLIDMAMQPPAWESLVRYRERYGLPLHLAAHWLIDPEKDIELIRKQIDQAIEMKRKFNPESSSDFCIVGIKLISDGVVDGCTAALNRPYGGMTDLVAPLWSQEMMDFAVQYATDAGLQCAIHAIGDFAVNQAINSIEKTGNTTARHRIEHLEVTTAKDAARLGKLGITASVQPVHSDPVGLRAYKTLIGAERLERIFAYKEFHEGNACLAFGTDAPTAKHLPLANLYNASTRRSALNPALTEQTNSKHILSLFHSVVAATKGAAYSRFAENWTGSLEPGLRADFVVISSAWTAESLLEAKVTQTWKDGRQVFQLED